MQAQYKKFTYKVVKLQELPRKNQPGTTQVDLNHLINQLDRPSSYQEAFLLRGGNKKGSQSLEQKLYFYKDTAADDMRVLNHNQYHNFFNAFFQPYNAHGDVFLVPDDIWLMISLYLSNYIDKNAQKLRPKLVKHQGQKELIINQYANSIQQSLKMEKEWDFFFKEIIKEIQKNTVLGTVEALSCNFTTTDEVYKLISTSIIMSSLKKYFTFRRGICMCGLNNIYFAGTREDWLKVKNKLQFLIQYDVDGQLKKYVENVAVILKNFIDTFDEKPDVNWWNTIMTSQIRRIGSGGDTQTLIEGWMLHLYGIYTKIEIGQLPKTMVSVPIKLVNQLTKTQKKLELIANWVSVSKVNEYTYKPDIGVCLLERQRTKLT